MTNNKFRWYHYLMVPLGAQIGIVIACGVVLIIQLFVYESMEEDIVVFTGECTVNGIAVGDTYTTMTCGEDTRSLSRNALEAPYLIEVLTNNRTPVIVCTKTMSEYLGNIHWDCQMDPEKEPT